LWHPACLKKKSDVIKEKTTISLYIQQYGYNNNNNNNKKASNNNKQIYMGIRKHIYLTKDKYEHAKV